MARRRRSKNKDREKLKRDIKMGAALTIGAAMAGLAIRGAMVLATAGWEMVQGKSNGNGTQQPQQSVTGYQQF